MMVNGKMIKWMVMVYIYIQMEINMKDIGLVDVKMEKENILLQMEDHMKENGKCIK